MFEIWAKETIDSKFILERKKKLDIKKEIIKIVGLVLVISILLYSIVNRYELKPSSEWVSLWGIIIAAIVTSLAGIYGVILTFRLAKDRELEKKFIEIEKNYTTHRFNIIRFNTFFEDMNSLIKDSLRKGINNIESNRIEKLKKELNNLEKIIPELTEKSLKNIDNQSLNDSLNIYYKCININWEKLKKSYNMVLNKSNPHSITLDYNEFYNDLKITYTLLAVAVYGFNNSIHIQER